MQTPTHSRTNKVSLRTCLSPQSLTPTVPLGLHLEQSRGFHKRNDTYSQVYFSPRNIHCPQNTRQLKNSISSKLIGQTNNYCLSENANHKLQKDNELLKDLVKMLRNQLHVLRYQRLNDQDAKNQAINQIYQNFNLKLSVKNTSLSQIRKICTQLKQFLQNNSNHYIHTQADEILSIINNNQTNILVRESVYQNQQVAKDKVIIVYREQQAITNQTQFKNNQKMTRSQHIQNQQQCHIEFENMRIQMQNLRKLGLEREEKIKSLQVQKQYLYQNFKQQEIKSTLKQLKLLHQKIQQYQKTQQNIQNQRQTIIQERNTYKQTIKSLQSRLLQNSFQQHMFSMLKERLSLYQNIIEKQKGDILKLQQNASVTKQSLLIKNQQMSISQTVQKSENNPQLIQDRRNSLNFKKQNRVSQILTAPELSKVYQLQNQNAQLYKSLKNAQNHIFQIQNKKKQQIIQLQEFKIKYKSQKQKYQNLLLQVKQIKQISLSIGNLNKQDGRKQCEYFRYKTDPRYKDVQKKLYDFKTIYTNQSIIAKQFMNKYKESQQKQQQQLGSIVRDVFDQLKKFDQTIIIQKSTLKRFNKGKLVSVLNSVRKIKEDNQKLKENIILQMNKDFFRNSKIFNGAGKLKM